MGRVKLVTFVPTTHANAVRNALGDAGAGVIGDYTYCSYTIVGKGRYKSSNTSKPFIGSAGQFEEVEEERIEVVCDRIKAKTAIAAMRSVHPYEEVAFDIYPLLNEHEV